MNKPIARRNCEILEQLLSNLPPRTVIKRLEEKLSILSIHEPAGSWFKERFKPDPISGRSLALQEALLRLRLFGLLEYSWVLCGPEEIDIIEPSITMNNYQFSDAEKVYLKELASKIDLGY